MGPEEDRDQSRIYFCAFCDTKKPTTRHHLVPQSITRARKIPPSECVRTCEDCHGDIHFFFSNHELAEHYSTVEVLKPALAHRKATTPRETLPANQVRQRIVFGVLRRLGLLGRDEAANVWAEVKAQVEARMAGDPDPPRETSKFPLPQDSMKALERVLETPVDVGFWWCESHRRHAVFTRNSRPCCASALPGIELPCYCVDLKTKDNLDARVAQNIERVFPKNVDVGGTPAASTICPKCSKVLYPVRQMHLSQVLIAFWICRDGCGHRVYTTFGERVRREALGISKSPVVLIAGTSPSGGEGDSARLSGAAISDSTSNHLIGTMSPL